MKVKEKTTTSEKLAPFLTAALAIPGIGLQSESALAQTTTDHFQARLAYADYEDFQPGEDRIRTHTPMLWVRGPLGEKTDIEGTFVLDTISGASPFYHDSLSGASGKGIDDTRTAEDIKVTHEFEGWSLSLGGALSNEEDYDSAGGTVQTSFWTPDKNTIYTVGVGGNGDEITSNDNSDIDGSRTTFSYLAGVTQVISPVSVFQSNINFTRGDGYYNDPYKVLDNRPRGREMWAWLNRYNIYLKDSDSALHTDYRLYWDTWGVVGNTFEVAWYKPYGSWLFRPSVRYHTQSGADFFSSVFPPPSFDIYYTADQRLATFGGFTTGIKVSRDLGSGYGLDLGFDYLFQNPGLALGGGGQTVNEPFFATMYWVGLSKNFN